MEYWSIGVMEHWKKERTGTGLQRASFPFEFRFSLFEESAGRFLVVSRF